MLRSPLTGRDSRRGSGTALQGAPIFAQKCASCHGATGREGPWDTLVSEEDEALRRRFFATSIWDFINRYMPPVKRTRWDQGGLLKPDEVYALTAFLLHQNRIIGETEVMDAQKSAADPHAESSQRRPALQRLPSVRRAYEFLSESAHVEGGSSKRPLPGFRPSHGTNCGSPRGRPSRRRSFRATFRPNRVSSAL